MWRGVARAVAMLVVVLATASLSRVGAIRRQKYVLPSDVDGDHVCVQQMTSARRACDGLKYGKSSDACNFACCYSADLNRERCADVVTQGTPTNLNFPAHLDELKKFHGIKCDEIPNAKHDCP